MNGLVRCCLALALTALCASAAARKPGETRLVPGDHPTIGEAIEAARDGDTILVSPGTYREFVDFQGKSITIASLLFIAAPAGTAERTVIEAPAPGRAVVSLVNGEDRRAILYGFTIRGGSTTDGGGVLCRGTSPTILHNIVEGNRASGRGGGICLLASRAALRFNRLQGNRAAAGGGLYVGRGSEARIHFNTFIDNEAHGDGGAVLLDGKQMAYARANDLLENRAGRGGGLAVTGGANFLFHRNKAARNSAAEGGGIFAAAAEKAYISSNTIQGNESVSGGGGLITSAGNTPAGGLVRDNMIHGNLAADRGGGLLLRGARPLVLGNSLMLNSALAEGGAVFCSAGRFTGGPFPALRLKDNLVAGNLGLGAVVGETPGLLKLEGTRFMHNQGRDLVDGLEDEAPAPETPSEETPFDSA